MLISCYLSFNKWSRHFKVYIIKVQKKLYSAFSKIIMKCWLTNGSIFLNVWTRVFVSRAHVSDKAKK